MNINEEIPSEASSTTQESTPVNNSTVDTMESLIEEFSPKEILERGEIVDGTVINIQDNGLVIDLGQKSEGFVPKNEMRSLTNTETYEKGKTLITYVIFPETQEGTILLSVDRARGEQGWKTLDVARQEGKTLIGKIVDSNKGGAVVECEGVQGFVPLSQLIGPARELYTPSGPPKPGFIGMAVEFRITELNRRRNRAIFSERAALEAVKLKLKSERIKDLHVGDVVKGKVLGTSKFGVFVEMDGADGLIHISELSWDTVLDPENFVQIGTSLDVQIIKIDLENLRIALSLKRLQPEPWDMISSDVSVGTIMKGTITKLASFGAFARVKGGLEGLIHLSELSYDKIDVPSDVVSEGQEVEVKIIKIEEERKRLGLSLLLDKEINDPDTEEGDSSQSTNPKDKNPEDNVEENSEDNVDVEENSEDNVEENSEEKN
ncbi:MAG: S1 RNA-binding domain-containing protein [Dehalococcoidia bacterium]|mgnify:FL=1|nr:S1 RNA-binding domain-containing protein [Chloroflexota bacterium]|tara:strand:+ start:611 stop:1912 length:1302 start_codon:yes stop_codon:yes gene_type:complete